MTHHIYIKHEYRWKGYLYLIKYYQGKITFQALLFIKR